MIMCVTGVWVTTELWATVKDINYDFAQDLKRMPRDIAKTLIRNFANFSSPS